MAEVGTAAVGTIGFIGAGEQAKMHLLAMKTVRPSLTECTIATANIAQALIQIPRNRSPSTATMRARKPWV